MTLVRSLTLFLLAGLCKIGGGWLVWKWLRDDRPDVLGASIAPVGVCLMIYWPRTRGALVGPPLVSYIRLDE